MSGKNKKHNSIIFLTTLSVYLSLSLLGATPQILAYAATTRDFDIQTEIEFKEDLENKPDSDEAEIVEKEDFPDIFAALLSELKENIQSGKLYHPLPGKFQYSNWKTIEAEHKRSSLIETNSNLGHFLQRKIDSKVLPQAIKLADYIDSRKSAKVSINGSPAEFSFKVSFSKTNAKQFADFLNREFSASAKSAENKILKQIYENTKVSFKDNQVFVITRLPRAGIDSLIQ